MIDCAYIGDSIAVGLQQLEPRCAIHAKVGANTDFIVRNYSGEYGKYYTIISMGSNWPDNPNNLDNIVKLRRSIHSKKVIWILPYKRNIAYLVSQIAVQFNDSYVDLHGIPSKDHLHPDYKTAHAMIEKVLK